MKVRWEWQVDGHVVTAELSLLTGREVVRVDQTTLFDKISMKFRNDVTVPLHGGREGRVLVRLRGILPACSLVVDGQEIPPTLGPRGAAGKLTWWAWGFIGACILIPIVAVGGAVPVVIGLVSAAANQSIATSERPNSSKIWMLSGVTLLAWLAFFGLILATAALRSRP